MLVHRSGKVASHISFHELVTKSLKKHFTKTQLPKSLQGEWKFLRKPPPEKSDKSKKHSHEKKKSSECFSHEGIWPSHFTMQYPFFSIFSGKFLSLLTAQCGINLCDSWQSQFYFSSVGRVLPDWISLQVNCL